MRPSIKTPKRTNSSIKSIMSQKTLSPKTSQMISTTSLSPSQISLTRSKSNSKKKSKYKPFKAAMEPLQEDKIVSQFYSLYDIERSMVSGISYVEDFCSVLDFWL